MSTVTATKTKTYDLAYVAVFAVLIAICSWISIPMTVPFTLQTFGVFMAVGVLGGKRGSLAVLVYILLGAIGVPVFAGFFREDLVFFLTIPAVTSSDFFSPPW